jgi:gmma-aminobutyric acid receptor subunit gamma
LELADFPFDTQELTLVVTCNRPNIVHFVENEEYPSIFMYQDFQLSSLFDVVYYEYVFCSSSLSDPAESSSGYRYPRFHFTVTLARQAGYYLSNVCTPICFISMLSLISLGIDLDGFTLTTADRLSISLTLLLTGVAYKFVVASSLPQLSYQTLLDYYIWCCFGFLILVTLENTIYPLVLYHYRRYYPDIVMDSVENYIAIILGMSFVLMNVLWISKVILMIKRQSNHFDAAYRKEKTKRAAAKSRRT